MKTQLSSLLCSRIIRLALLGAVTWLQPVEAKAVVSAGGLAVVGYDDGLDTFSVVALENVSAGEVIYFTNNGWSTTQSKFSGSDPSQGAGNESVIMLTATNQIKKGTVLTSSSDGSGWAWTRTGLIPGQVDGFGEFSDLSIDFESDQIYAFQASSDNPLGNPTNFIYALHFGSPDYAGFSDAEDTLTGAVPPSLSTAAFTAFAHTDFGFHGDADGNNSAWGLNYSAPAILALQTSGGHKEDWLAAIGNSSNWGPGQPVVAAGLLVMPEPGRALLLAFGVAGLIWRRRRICNLQ